LLGITIEWIQICVEADPETEWKGFTSRGERVAMHPDGGGRERGPRTYLLKTVGPQQIAVKCRPPTAGVRYMLIHESPLKT